MKIAAISDIHGNLAALKAVLAEIKGHAPDLIVNLGDSLSGLLFPVECADCLLSLDIPTIRGNHERQLLTLPVDEMGESDRYAMSCLETHHLRWIEHTPTTLLIEREIQLVHGTPESDLGYFLETVEPQGVREANPLAIHDRAHEVSAPLILCGHAHIPRSVSLGDGRLVVNPGSVGLPAYEDDRPFPHKCRLDRRTHGTHSWRNATVLGQRNCIRPSTTGRLLPSWPRAVDEWIGLRLYGRALSNLHVVGSTCQSQTPTPSSQRLLSKSSFLNSGAVNLDWRIRGSSLIDRLRPIDALEKCFALQAPHDIFKCGAHAPRRVVRCATTIRPS
jgi:predicted phosphodiesterase